MADSSKDLDVGIVLAPAIGKTDWALGAFYALGDAWQAELGHIVGRHVSLQAMLPGNEGDVEIRSTGVRIWSRV
jgi:predicted Rdx family selenoprotein